MLRFLVEEDIFQVASIHKQELSGFLPELGQKFLEKFYMSSLNLPEMFTIVDEDAGRISGFVTGVESTKGLLKKILLQDIFGFGIIFSTYLITHPPGLVKLIKTVFYPGFSEDGPELLTIAISSKYQKKGLGRKLFQACAEEFTKRKIKKFKISVYDRLPANGFYKKMNCRQVTSFDFLGEKMNYYLHEKNQRQATP